MLLSSFHPRCYYHAAFVRKVLNSCVSEYLVCQRLLNFFILTMGDKFFFQVEVIIIVLVSVFCFI